MKMSKISSYFGCYRSADCSGSLVGCSYGLAYAGAFGGRFIEIMVAGVGFCKWFALLAV